MSQTYCRVRGSCSENGIQTVKRFVHISKWKIRRNVIKTLGVSWNPFLDIFRFSVNLNSEQAITKRSILSTVAKIFDPLGLISPVAVKAKLIIQKLWQARLEWDDAVPEDIANS